MLKIDIYRKDGKVTNLKLSGSGWDVSSNERFLVIKNGKDVHQLFNIDTIDSVDFDYDGGEEDE